MITHISHYADVIGIFVFFLLTSYFSKISKRTRFENLLLFFSASGLVLDTLFTLQYVLTLYKWI
jgi:hypothetical protein